MDTFLQFLEQRKTYVALVGGAVLGLLLGLLIGWGLWPVEWINSTPGNLRSDFRDDYLLWVGEQFAATGDAEWARSKLGAEYWKEGQLSETLDALAIERGGETGAHLRDLKDAVEAVPEAPLPTESAVTEEPEAAVSLWERARPLLMVCAVALLVLAVVGCALFVVTRLRGRQPAAAETVPDMGTGLAEVFAPSGQDWGQEGTPQAQFVTTYAIGDDHYDPSFAIELESGEFMGECGVGISENIGVGDPSKVTALEVWLFDKNDIRTVTKVLMSEYAFNDDALHAKLAPKGEPVLASPGEDVFLETKRLRVRARILEAEYGAGNLPPNSFFSRLKIDLAAWVKQEQSATGQGAATIPSMMAPTI
jgi:hypothetical protein